MNKVKRIVVITMIGVFGFSAVSLAAYVSPTGTVEGRVKAYNADGNYMHKKVKKAKVRLYKKNGKKVDSDKSNRKGKFEFKDVELGKYYVKCSANGYVNAKKESKTSYKTKIFKVKDGKTVKVNCRLRNEDEKVDGINYGERPKGTSKREWRIIMGV